MKFNKLQSFRFLIVALSAALVCPGGSAFGEQRTFTLDPGQTKVDFTLGDVLHTVHGEFRLKRGTIQLDDSNGTASGELVVDATSGESGNKSRDKKMNKEILESQKYPEITFTPQRFQGSLATQGKSHLAIDGSFSIHGESHPMTLNIDTDTEHGDASAVTSFSVPYVKWGMKNPSTFILRVSDKVEINIHAMAHVSAPPTQARK